MLPGFIVGTTRDYLFQRPNPAPGSWMCSVVASAPWVAPNLPPSASDNSCSSHEELLLGPTSTFSNLHTALPHGNRKFPKPFYLTMEIPCGSLHVFSNLAAGPVQSCQPSPHFCLLPVPPPGPQSSSVEPVWCSVPLSAHARSHLGLSPHLSDVATTLQTPKGTSGFSFSLKYVYMVP